MRRLLIIAMLALGLALSQSAAAADSKPSSNEIVAGEVTIIDKATHRITVRSSDGSLHEFEATQATLDDLKVGDRIEARKRAGSE
jgi:Cu/Ag efflux protein CusF